jgi:hypothetical protein
MGRFGKFDIRSLKLSIPENEILDVIPLATLTAGA